MFINIVVIKQPDAFNKAVKKNKLKNKNHRLNQQLWIINENFCESGTNELSKVLTTPFCFVIPPPFILNCFLFVVFHFPHFFFNTHNTSINLNLNVPHVNFRIDFFICMFSLKKKYNQINLRVFVFKHSLFFVILMDLQFCWKIMRSPE